MMRTLSKMALVAGLVVVMAGPALAQRQRGQGQGGGRGGMGMQGGVGLLSNQAVQEELKLTDKQKEDLKGVMDKMREASTGVNEKVRDIQDRQEQRTKRTELMKPINEEAQSAASKILDEKQNKRFKQIELQVSAQRQGPAVFKQEEVAKALSLNDEQKGKIDTIVKDYTKERQELMPQRGQGGQGGNRGAGGAGGRGGFNPETMQKVQTLTKEAMDKAADVLTPDQKTTWKNLQGEPFKMPAPGQGRTDR